MAITTLSFSKAFFFKMFSVHNKMQIKAGVFEFHTGLKKVFKKLCVHDELVLMVGLKP